MEVHAPNPQQEAFQRERLRREKIRFKRQPSAVTFRIARPPNAMLVVYVYALRVPGSAGGQRVHRYTLGGVPSLTYGEKIRFYRRQVVSLPAAYQSLLHNA